MDYNRQDSRRHLDRRVRQVGGEGIYRLHACEGSYLQSGDSFEDGGN